MIDNISLLTRGVFCACDKELIVRGPVRLLFSNPVVRDGSLIYTSANHVYQPHLCS